MFSTHAIFNKKYLLPVIIIALTMLIIQWLSSNPPKAERRGMPETKAIAVEVLPLKPQTLDLTLSSYGIVQPRTKSILNSQVSGEVVFINEQFRDGGIFKKGDVLVKLDDRDLRHKLVAAKATLAQMEQALYEEQARVEQAKDDWQRLNPGQIPNSPLVLREPQLAVAQAKLAAAKADVELASLNVARSEIKAPFTGRILSKKVDLGQVVNSGTSLAEIYASDALEVRLPIKPQDLALLALPEQRSSAIPVELTSDLLGQQQWQAHLVRTESAIDSQSQQLHVIARLNPEQANTPKIGQYVTAKISGQTVADVIVLPNSAIYQNSYVYIFKDNALFQRVVDIQWQDSKQSIIQAGLNAGELLVTTPLGQITSGTAAKILGKEQVGKSRRSPADAKQDSAQGQTVTKGNAL